MLIKTLEMSAAGTVRLKPQDHNLATLAPRLDREAGLIRWENDCREIVSLIRGLSPVPCAYTGLDGKILKVFKAAAEPATPAEAPGTIAGETPGAIRVTAGNGYVLLKEVQLEGKKRMAVCEFLRGCRALPGQILG
jgi:methionyl-tRNA formyltransferase